MSLLFAATYPERTRALVLYGAYAHFHTWVMDKDALEQFIRNVDKNWGTGAEVCLVLPPNRQRTSAFAIGGRAMNACR